MKTKIVPGMSDDWEIVPSQYVKIGGFSLHSKKLNQSVADIDLLRFLRFSKEQKLVIDTLLLQGEYVIGNDRSVYTKEMYETWKNKFDKRTEIITEKKDAQIGHEYKTPCGQHLIYCGARYVGNIKDSGFKDDDFSQRTSITKKHFIIPAEKPSYGCGRGVAELGNKLTEDMGAKYTPEEIDEFMYEYYQLKQSLFCFEKTKPSKDVEIGLIEHELPRRFTGYYGNDLQSLFVECDGTLYTGNNGSNYVKTVYYGSEIEMPRGERPDQYNSYSWDEQKRVFDKSSTMNGYYATSYVSMNKETLEITGTKGRRYGYDQLPEIKVDKLLRLGIL
jgi:hypothetical protein